MDPSAEVPLVERPLTPEKETFLKSLPSPRALHQEASKIIHNPHLLQFDQIVSSLGLTAATRGVEDIKNKVPNLPNLSNLAKVKLARTAALYDLFRGSLFPSDHAARNAVDLITADYRIREDAKALVQLSRKEYTNESALITDTNYIRQFGGTALEQRFKEGRLSRSQATAIASVFHISEIPLSTLEKARIINHFVTNPDSPTIKLPGTTLSQQDVTRIVQEIGLRGRAMDTLVYNMFSRTDNTEFLAYSRFVPLLSKVILEFRRTQSQAGLQAAIEEITRQEQLPEKITDLREIIDVVKNHPDIKAVSIDLYDTLAQWSSSQGERQQRLNQLMAFQLKKQFGINIDPDRLKKATSPAWARRWSEFQHKGIEVPITETFSWVIDDLLKDVRVTGGKSLTSERDKMIKALEKGWYRVELETAVAMPGALETLRQLKAMGIKIGLTSNASWDKAHVTRVLNKFGLRNYLDEISISSEHGRMKKPNIPDFFHHSWQKLGINPKEVLHIGDNRWDDVEGARNAGGRAIVYDNPKAFNDIDTLNNPNEYASRALSYHLTALNQEALSNIEAYMDKFKVPPGERERVRGMAKEIYQKSRDVVGPAQLALAHQLLTKLSNGESDINLCLARDGLASSIAQKLLLHLEPDRYPGAKADQIKYTYVSRKFLEQIQKDPEFRSKYEIYLKRLGLDKAQKVILTDLLSGSGTTHQGLVELLSRKQVEGFYLDAHNEIPNVHSFLKESLNDSGAQLNTTNLLILFEALYSGPFQSTKDMVEKSKIGVSPRLERKGNFPAKVLTRGLSEQSLLMMNQIAIQGLRDSTSTFHRRRMLGFIDEPPKETMERFYTFIASPLSPIWEDIWRSVPWQDYEEWYIPSINEQEKAKITPRTP